MVCTCSDDGAAQAEALMMEVIERLSRGSDVLHPTTIEPGNFLTSIVTSLNVDFNAHVTSIDADQWFAVAAADDSGRGYYVQCDLVEHGIAAVWKAFADNPNVSIGHSV